MSNNQPTKVSLVVKTIKQEKTSIEEIREANRPYFEAIASEIGKEAAQKAEEKYLAEVRLELEKAEEGEVEVTLVHIE